MHKMNVTNELDRARAEMRTALRGEIVYTFANVPSEVEASHSSFLQDADQLDKSLKERKSLPLTDRGKQLTGQMQADLSQWRSKEDDVYRLCRNNQPLDAITLAKNDIRPLTDDVAAALAEIRVTQSKQLRSADQSTENRADFSSVALPGVYRKWNCCPIHLLEARTHHWRNSAPAIQKTSRRNRAGVAGRGADFLVLAGTGPRRSTAGGISRRDFFLTQEIQSMTSQNAHHAETATQLMGAVSLEIRMETANYPRW